MVRVYSIRNALIIWGIIGSDTSLFGRFPLCDSGACKPVGIYVAQADKAFFQNYDCRKVNRGEPFEDPPIDSRLRLYDVTSLCKDYILAHSYPDYIDPISKNESNKANNNDRTQQLGSPPVKDEEYNQEDDHIQMTNPYILSVRWYQDRNIFQLDLENDILDYYHNNPLFIQRDKDLIEKARHFYTNFKDRRYPIYMTLTSESSAERISVNMFQNPNLLLLFMTDALMAVHYLHSLGISHQNLTLHSFLYQKKASELRAANSFFLMHFGSHLLPSLDGLTASSPLVNPITLSTMHVGLKQSLKHGFYEDYTQVFHIFLLEVCKGTIAPESQVIVSFGICDQYLFAKNFLILYHQLLLTHSSDFSVLLQTLTAVILSPDFEGIHPRQKSQRVSRTLLIDTHKNFNPLLNYIQLVRHKSRELFRLSDYSPHLVTPTWRNIPFFTALDEFVRTLERLVLILFPRLEEVPKGNFLYSLYSVTQRIFSAFPTGSTVLSFQRYTTFCQRFQLFDSSFLDDISMHLHSLLLLSFFSPLLRGITSACSTYNNITMKSNHRLLDKSLSFHSSTEISGLLPTWLVALQMNLAFQEVFQRYVSTETLIRQESEAYREGIKEKEAARNRQTKLGTIDSYLTRNKVSNGLSLFRHKTDRERVNEKVASFNLKQEDFSYLRSGKHAMPTMLRNGAANLESPWKKAYEASILQLDGMETVKTLIYSLLPTSHILLGLSFGTTSSLPYITENSNLRSFLASVYLTEVSTIMDPRLQKTLSEMHQFFDMQQVMMLRDLSIASSFELKSKAMSIDSFFYNCIRETRVGVKLVPMMEVTGLCNSTAMCRISALDTVSHNSYHLLFSIYQNLLLHSEASANFHYGVKELIAYLSDGWYTIFRMLPMRTEGYYLNLILSTRLLPCLRLSQKDFEACTSMLEGRGKAAMELLRGTMKKEAESTIEISHFLMGLKAYLETARVNILSPSLLQPLFRKSREDLLKQEASTIMNLATKIFNCPDFLFGENNKALAELLVILSTDKDMQEQRSTLLKKIVNQGHLMNKFMQSVSSSFFVVVQLKKKIEVHRLYRLFYSKLINAGVSSPKILELQAKIKKASSSIKLHENELKLTSSSELYFKQLMLLLDNFSDLVESPYLLAFIYRDPVEESPHYTVDSIHPKSDFMNNNNNNIETMKSEDKNSRLLNDIHRIVSSTTGFTYLNEIIFTTREDEVLHDLLKSGRMYNHPGLEKFLISSLSLIHQGYENVLKLMRENITELDAIVKYAKYFGVRLSAYENTMWLGSSSFIARLNILSEKVIDIAKYKEYYTLARCLSSGFQVPQDAKALRTIKEYISQERARLTEAPLFLTRYRQSLQPALVQSINDDTSEHHQRELLFPEELRNAQVELEICMKRAYDIHGAKSLPDIVVNPITEEDYSFLRTPPHWREELSREDDVITKDTSLSKADLNASRRSSAFARLDVVLARIEAQFPPTTLQLKHSIFSLSIRDLDLGTRFAQWFTAAQDNNTVNSTQYITPETLKQMISSLEKELKSIKRDQYSITSFRAEEKEHLHGQPYILLCEDSSHPLAHPSSLLTYAEVHCGPQLLTLKSKHQKYFNDIENTILPLRFCSPHLETSKVMDYTSKIPDIYAYSPSESRRSSNQSPLFTPALPKYDRDELKKLWNAFTIKLADILVIQQKNSALLKITNPTN